MCGGMGRGGGWMVVLWVREGLEGGREKRLCRSVGG